MTTFDEREQAFERKFAMDADLRFRATARRNRLIGLWAAEKLGLSGAEADAYAKEVVRSDFAKPGDDDIIGKLSQDFQANNVQQSDDQIRATLIEMLAKAISQIEAAGKSTS